MVACCRSCLLGGLLGLEALAAGTGKAGLGAPSVPGVLSAALRSRPPTPKLLNESAPALGRALSRCHPPPCTVTAAPFLPWHAGLQSARGKAGALWLLVSGEPWGFGVAERLWVLSKSSRWVRITRHSLCYRRRLPLSLSLHAAPVSHPGRLPPGLAVAGSRSLCRLCRQQGASCRRSGAGEPGGSCLAVTHSLSAFLCGR